MEFLRDLHGFQLPIRLVGHYLVLLTALLFVWSLVFIVRPTVPRGFVVLMRLTWVAFAVNALSGAILALLGQRVPSAVAAPGSRLTRYGFPPDPSRHWEHLMYALFVLISLYAMEVLVAGKVVRHGAGLRLMFVLTLFLWGVAFRSGQVAYLPGATPGT